MVSTTVDTSRWRLSSLRSNKELRGPSPRRNSISFCRFLILSISTRWPCKVWLRLVIVYNENIKRFTRDRCLEREIKRFSLDLFKRKSKYYFWGKDVNTGWGHEKGFLWWERGVLRCFWEYLFFENSPPSKKKSWKMFSEDFIFIKVLGRTLPETKFPSNPHSPK